MKLQPMNVGEILDRTFKIYGEQFKSYLAIAALGMGALWVIFVACDLLIPGRGLVGTGVPLLVEIVVFLLVGGAIIKKASLQIREQSIGVAAAYRFSFRRLGRLFLGGLLRWLAIVIGWIFIFIPGMWAFVSFSLFTQALIIEDRGAWRALGRSRKLVRRTWWRVFGILLLIGLLVGVLAGIIEVPLYVFVFRHLFAAIGAHRVVSLSIGARVVLQIVTAIVASFTAPFTAIACTLLYYDLRIRKENLDLEVMVDDLTAGPVGGAPA